MPKAAIQNILPIDTIRDDTVVLKVGGLRAVLLCSSINFALKSADEQKAVISQFQQFLNALDFSLQIIIQSRKVNVKNYIQGLEDLMAQQNNDLLKFQTKDYAEFIKALTQGTNVMAKNFLVVVPFSPYEAKSRGGGFGAVTSLFKAKQVGKMSGEDFAHYKNQLWQRVEYVASGLASFGVNAQLLETPELIELFWGTYNIDLLETGNYPIIPEELLNQGLKTEVRTTQQEKSLAKEEVKVLDIIAPTAFEVKSNLAKVGKKFCRTFFIYTYPRYLTTGWFSPIINMDWPMDISFVIHPQETGQVLKNLMRKVTEVEAEIMERESKGLIRDPKLEAAYRNLENLRDRLQTSEERMFKFGIYISVYADVPEELEKAETQVRQVLESHLVYMKSALYQQKEGYTSTNPFLLDQLQVYTMLNTSPLSTLFPFVSFDLSAGEGILYGINRHNNSLILFDRFSLENANMTIFAKSGSGKSYFSKLEILRSMMTGTDVIVIDPENEYEYLTETVAGSFFKISLNSPRHINPFDLPTPLEGEDPADVLRSNIINLVGLLRIMLGGLTPEEDAIIDRAIAETYAARDITPESDFSKIEMPLMSDFQVVLEGMEGAESLVKRLEKYTKGTFAGFLNQPTNISLENQLVVFSIRDMEEELRPIAMFLILRYIWNGIRRKLKKRIVIVDEAWWLMRHDDGASFLYGLAKRARKYWLGLTTITQDVNDFMKSPYGQPIITNSSLQMLLKQSPATMDVVQKTFNLTEEEKYLLLEAEVGEGLFFAGTKHVAIKVVASLTEDKIVTSKPEEILERKENL